MHRKANVAHNGRQGNVPALRPAKFAPTPPKKGHLPPLPATAAWKACVLPIYGRIVFGIMAMRGQMCTNAI